MSRIFDDFCPPPPPVTNCHKSWTPLLKVCHTSEQKVKQISRRMETALNNYNRYYYILNNNNGCLSVSNEPWNKPWNTLTSLISYNSEGDSCSLNLYYAWIKYKMKRKIVNCEKIESVTSHDLYPLPCHKLSHFLRPLPPLKRDILYGRSLVADE